MEPNNRVTIAVHNGEFHADDAFAVATLLLMLKGFYQVEILRTRDPEVINKADYVIDVGGVYDEEKKRFDHHQSGGAGKRENGIPYASFGLVWKKWGSEVSGSERIAEILDKKIVIPVDAVDNGFNLSKQLYPGILYYDVSGIIASMNSTWKENPKLADERFIHAVRFAQELISREIAVAEHNLEAEEFVIDAYNKTEDKRLIILEENYPAAATLAKFPEPLYVVYPKDENWNLKAIRADEAVFGNRKDLPEAWAGKRDSELAEVSGVPDAIFCHNSRFMAIAKSKEGALALAKKALDA